MRARKFDPIALMEPVRSRIQEPIVILLGSPRLVSTLVAELGDNITVFQMDLYQAERLAFELSERNLTATIEVHPDLWDLPCQFKTAIFPVTAYGERELKLDILEQAHQVLVPGGMLLSVSEYQADQLLPKAHKKVFGKCSELPASRLGSVFWSYKEADESRRRHQQIFHAKHREFASHEFCSRPGVFSYGKLDMGSRALVEVAEIEKGESVLDLGCGTGAVGIMAWDLVGPTGSITFVDSNLRAMALAKLNAEANGVGNFELIASHDLQNIPPQSFDVVLANPPYYANSTIAQRFMENSRRLLKPGGKFYLVTKQIYALEGYVSALFPECEAYETRGYHVIRAINGQRPA